MTGGVEIWIVCVLVVDSDCVIVTISELSMLNSVVSVLTISAVIVLMIGDETDGVLVAD